MIKIIIDIKKLDDMQKRKLNFFSNNLIKNHQIFMTLVVGDINFFREILKWRKKIGIRREPIGSIFECKSEEEMEQKRQEAHRYKSEILKKLRVGRETSIQFFDWLNNFIEKYRKFGLTELWKNPIALYIACGFYSPPDGAVGINLDEDKNCIFIRINQNSSLNDIKSSWKIIEELKLKLKKIKKPRLKRRFADNFGKFMESLKLPQNELDKEEWKKYNITDCDRVSKLYLDGTPEEDRKRAIKLRVNRHRIKKLTESS